MDRSPPPRPNKVQMEIQRKRRGARRPTGTTAQEVYQALAGVGVSQEPIGTPAREESLLIEECVLVGGVQDDIGSEVPQQVNAESHTLGGGDHFGIPARLIETAPDVPNNPG